MSAHAQGMPATVAPKLPSSGVLYYFFLPPLVPAVAFLGFASAAKYFRIDGGSMTARCSLAMVFQGKVHTMSFLSTSAHRRFVGSPFIWYTSPASALLSA